MKKYSGKAEQVIHTPVFRVEGIDTRVNEVVPLFVSLSKDSSLRDTLNRIQDTVRESYAYQNYPLKLLNETISRNTFSGNVLLSLNSIHEPTRARHNYDLHLDLRKGSDSKFIEIVLTYNPYAFDRYFIGHFQRHIEEVLKAFNHPDTPVKDIRVISADEERLLLDVFSQGQKVDRPEKTASDIFEEQVNSHPDNVAICFPGGELRYIEVNEYANKLGRLMAESYGLEPGNVVALMMPRGELPIIALLAILKAGATYLPIDPALPRSRRELMIADAGVSLIVSATGTGEEYMVPVLQTDMKAIAALPAPSGNITLDKIPDDSAYVIYTSGSTGRPKGVEVSHRSLVNMSLSQIDLFGIQSGDTILQFAPLSFDASVSEIFTALFSGAALATVERDIIEDTGRMTAYLKDSSVSVVTFPPSYLSTFKASDLSFLRVMITAGEAANPAIAKEYCRRMTYFNAYGPTECTVCASLYKLTFSAELSGSIPIGKPIHNVNTYVLDDERNPVPIGLPGELCVSGVGLAKGYLNNPELTGEAFIHHPGLDTLLYHTGDLVRWNEEGELEYIGRKDDQLKLRGFRVEPGEITNILTSHSEVQEAVVLKGTGDELIAVVVPANEVPADDWKNQLQTYCRNRLPAYMVPTVYRKVQKLPLTRHGKVDKQALIELNEAALRSEKYVAPQNEMQVLVSGIWESALGRTQISVEDNFFAIGGDSIKGIQIVSRIHKAGYRADLKELYQNPTIRSFSGTIREAGLQIDQGPVVGKVPLTPIQKAFFRKDFMRPNHFNHAVMLHHPKGFDREAIKAVFTKIVEHHDALRMQFELADGTVTQYNRDTSWTTPLMEYDMRNWNENILNDGQTTEQAITSIADKLQASINLGTDPLIQLTLFQTDKGDRLLIIIHHLVVDTISWRILSEDIEELYGQYVAGKSLELPKKTHSFKTWAEGLTAYADGEKISTELAYWQKVNSLSWELPLDRQGTNRVSDAKSFGFTLNPETTRRLLTQANQAFHTEINDLLLSALSLAFKETFGTDKIVVNLEGHGRESILKDIDVSRTVGWFTTEFPVVLDSSRDNDLEGLIIETKERLRQVPEHGIGYGILKHLSTADHNLDNDFNAIGFNYLGQFDQEMNNMSFEIAKESHGATKYEGENRFHLLDISGMVADQELRLSVTYSEQQFKNETIQSLVKNYEKALSRIINYLSGIDSSKKTPSDLTYDNIRMQDYNRLSEQYDIHDLYPLSPMQQGMLFQAIFDKATSAYFDQTSYRIHGQLDPAFVEESLNDLINRHEVLRTAFVQTEDGKSLQLVQQFKKAEFTYEDLRNRGGQEEYIESYKKQDRDKGFVFSSGDLLRVTMLQLDEEVYEFIWSHHHILMDGWCIRILIAEFLELYNSHLQQRGHNLLPVQPYSQYIKWLDDQNYTDSQQYWSTYLKGYSETAVIPAMRSRNDYQVSEKHTQFFKRISEDKTQQLRRLAAEADVTLNNVIQTLWGILLSQYNNTNDVVFGTVVSGRPSQIAGIESMIGLFINSVPVRVQYDAHSTFIDLVQSVQKNAVASESHHYYPLADIQAASDLKQELIDHLLTFENYPIAEEIEGIMEEHRDTAGSARLEISKVDVFDQNHYDFNVLFGLGRELVMKLEYTQAFDNEYIKNIANQFAWLVDQVLADRTIQADKLSLVPAEDHTLLLEKFAEIKTEYPREASIASVFEDQVHRLPDEVALVFGDEKLTYRELNEKANRLAQYLITEHNVQPGAMVGILMDKSEWLMIGILGILKAGAAYVPIDA
ncbi:MAG: amino acid adenylation domain-containing protein, partial [Cyclobacteriaceae bacterium]